MFVSLLQEAEKRGKKLYLYTGPLPQAKANAAVLVSPARQKAAALQHRPGPCMGVEAAYVINLRCLALLEPATAAC
jgi:hypothetical protein